MKKRTWYYCLSPKDFEISPCSCGNTETQWSEFEKHLWCDKCEKDFIPEYNGVFDGPIAVQACALMGIHFDRINLETGKYEKFNRESLD